MPPSKHQARSPVHVESPAPNPFASNDDVLGALHGSDGGTGGAWGRKRRLAVHVRLLDGASYGWRAVESERLSSATPASRWDIRPELGCCRVGTHTARPPMPAFS
jgi:hypothetical protein